MNKKDFFRFTKVKAIFTITISIIILFLMFNNIYYQFCATDTLCMEEDIGCQKAQFSERWFCPLIPSLIALPFILGITYLLVCTIIHYKKKIFS